MSAHATIDRPKDVAAPSLIPGKPIDFDRLEAISQGDRKTIRELLAVVDLQTKVLSARMIGEAPKQAAARVHTLAATARSVGAWNLAECATDFERGALGRESVLLGPAMKRLSAAITDLHLAIDRYLSSNQRQQSRKEAAER